MYYINKIIGCVVSPVGLAIIGGAGALICARLKRQRVAKWLGWAAFVWLWLWMTPIMTWVVGVPLEREFLVDGRVPTVETFPAADAIILLGGGMGADTNHNSYAEMSSGADRVWQAARLFKAGKSSKIIATGDYAKDTTLPLLKEFGVGEEAVSFLDARITEEEAKGIRELFSRVERVERVDVSRKERKERKDDSRVEGGEGKILLVTSAWHMKRARLMFEKYAPEIEVVCAPADFENTFMAEKTPMFKMLLPDPYVFYLNSVAFHEWVGIVGYKVLDEEIGSRKERKERKDDGRVERVDGSRKERKDRKEGFELKWISERDRGMYDAINKGIKMATGDVVGILNSDDMLESPDTLAHIAAAFADEMEAVYADIRFVKDDLNTTVRYYGAKRWKPWMHNWGYMPPHPSVYIRRELFEKLGSYRLGYHISADFELMVRYLCRNRIKAVYLPECVVKMRLGGKSTKNWRANLLLNAENVRANRENGYFSCFAMMLPKYLFKVWGFIFRR